MSIKKIIDDATKRSGKKRPYKKQDIMGNRGIVGKNESPTARPVK
jgi:hypothetical protein